MAALALLEGAQAGELRATVRDREGRPVAGAVVVAVPQAPGALPARPRLEQIEQLDLEFVPGVKAVQVGSAVAFPNRDRVRHHVYSFSQPKRFEMSVLAGTEAPPVVFDTPGVVTVGCNIHDWMVGYIYVAESPFFAATAGDGRALVKGLPAGRYGVRVWHPRLASAEESTRREAVIRAERAAALDWRLELKPESYTPRAPAAGRRERK